MLLPYLSIVTYLSSWPVNFPYSPSSCICIFWMFHDSGPLWDNVGRRQGLLSGRRLAASLSSAMYYLCSRSNSPITQNPFSHLKNRDDGTFLWSLLWELKDIMNTKVPQRLPCSESLGHGNMYYYTSSVVISLSAFLNAGKHFLLSFSW